MIRVVFDTSVLVSAIISPAGPNAQVFELIIWVWLLWNDAPFDGIKPSLILFDVELPIAIKIS